MIYEKSFFWVCDKAWVAKKLQVIFIYNDISLETQDEKQDERIFKIIILFRFYCSDACRKKLTVY